MIIVQKFGGTSVGTTDRILEVAKIVVAEVERGNLVAVVVSAMSGQTNHLISLCNEISKNPNLENLPGYSAAISTGEIVTTGLLSVALQDLGYDAIPLTGSQIGLKTIGAYGKARIDEINSETILELLNAKKIPIIAGFQGCDRETGVTTTLSRGGSDTSAVAIAASVNADRCDIYTDIDGVYTTDPRICKSARKMNSIFYEEMLELASLGSKVLHPRSVGLGIKYGLTIKVLSTFKTDDPNNGTIIQPYFKDNMMEENIVTGIAVAKNEVQVTIYDMPNEPGVAAKIFALIGQYEINVDMIVQTASTKTKNLTFTVVDTDEEMLRDVLAKSKESVGFADFEFNEEVSKVSIVGSGMKSATGVAYQIFDALGKKGINIIAISTSEIKVSIIVDSSNTDEAVNALHDRFNLGKNV